jgi:PPOX class probable F420-dependent enzyme
MSVPPAALADARLDRFLTREPVVWLSTVRPDGAPHLVPIWFTWDGTSLLVFSKPEAQKVRNLRTHPVAMLALGEPEDDFDVALAEARVRLLDEPARELPEAHLAKYGERMAALGLTPDDFLATYSQVVVITPPGHCHGTAARRRGACSPLPRSRSRFPKWFAECTARQWGRARRPARTWLRPWARGGRGGRASWMRSCRHPRPHARRDIRSRSN